MLAWDIEVSAGGLRKAISSSMESLEGEEKNTVELTHS